MQKYQLQEKNTSKLILRAKKFQDEIMQRKRTEDRKKLTKEELENPFMISKLQQKRNRDYEHLMLQPLTEFAGKIRKDE